MEILELNLKHFGKFQEHRVLLGPGVNIIYGDNETGKSTIHAFIRAMLFGIGRSRGKSGRRDEYQLRQPWDNPAYFAGTMRLNYQGEIYRIERNFYKDDQEVHLICESRSQEMPAGQEQLQELLGGMNEVLFTNTIFVPQAGCETDEGLAQELRRFMVNMQESRDGNLDVAKALGILKGKRKELEIKKIKARELLDEKIACKQMESEYVERELQQSRMPEKTPGPDTGTEVSHMPEALREITDDCAPEQPQEAETSRFYDTFLFWLNSLLCLCGVAATAAGVFAGSIGAKAVLIAVGLLFLALFFMTMSYTVRSGELLRWLARWNGQEGEPAAAVSKEPDMGRASGSRREQSILQKHLEEGKLLWRREEEQRTQREKTKRLGELRRQTQELFQEREQLFSFDREMEAIDLAMLRIKELSSRIYREAGTDFGRMASAILEELTEGRYTQIALDEKMEVRINTPAKLLYLHQVSYGTMNQIYFALRMAAGQLMTEGGDLPIILDEPFVMYDEQRLEAVLRWLIGSGRQVILFTCQKREKEILDRIRRSV